MLRPDDVTPTDRMLLAEMLSERGFQTVGFYSGPFMDPAYGFGRGFDEYISCQGLETDRLRRLAALQKSHGNVTNPKILESFGSWARERAEAPFFAFVHMWDVHYDYTPPDDYVEMFDADYTGKLDGQKIARTGFPVAASQRDLAHLLARYDGEIRYTDDTLGLMLEVLEEVGLLDDTLVVVTSDHGDEFLEHGGKGHMATVYREVMHVPLVMWSGHRLSAGVIEEPVTLADVAPTVLDLLGIEASSPFDGRSLTPAFRGEPLSKEPIIGELYHRRGEASGLTLDNLTMASIREGDTKLVLAGRDPSLKRSRNWVEFDLANDPLEQSPRPVTNQTLRALLSQHLRTVQRRFLARSTAAKANALEALPSQVVEQLKTLGYVE